MMRNSIIRNIFLFCFLMLLLSFAYPAKCNGASFTPLEPNNFPEFIDLVNRGAVIDKTLEFQVKAEDAETPEPQLLYGVSDLPPNAIFDTQTRWFEWTPTSDDKGIYETTFSVTDGDGNTVTKTIRLSTVYIEIQEVVPKQGTYEYAYPVVDKNNFIVLMRDDSMDTYDLYMYDVATGSTRTVRTGLTNIHGLDLYEGKAVWAKRESPANVFTYDIDTGVEKRVTGLAFEQSFPSIHKDKIVWQDQRMGDSEIYMYELSKRQEKRITFLSGNKKTPAIFKDKIVWIDEQDGYDDIHMYDLSRQEQVKIPIKAGRKKHCDIYGNKIVWKALHDPVDDAPGEICIYDLSTNSTIVIPEDLYDTAYEVSISENKILWRNKDDGGDSVVMGKGFFVPEIMSISPKTAFPGQLITVRGRNFGFGEAPTWVMFDDETTILIDPCFDTEFSFYLPPRVKTGSFRVITLGGESNTVGLKVIPASVALDFDGTGKNEAIMHFRLDKGIRVWDEDEKTWGKLHDLGPELLARGNILRTAAGEQDIIIDFGPDVGLQVRHADRTWTKLHDLSPEKIISADINIDVLSEAIIDFGPGKGVRAWTGQWEFIYGEGTECMTAGDINNNGCDEVIMGIWEGGIKIRNNNGSIDGLHEMCPEIMAAGDVNGDNYDEIIAYFEGHGIYIYYPETREWKKLHDVPVESVTIGQVDGDAAGRSDIIIDFGEYGIKIWCNDTEWKKLHDLDPEWILVSDLDGSGQDDIIVDFGDGKGLWVWDNDSRWRKLHELSP